MSNTKSNAITKNYKGKFGNQVVFRNRNGKSIMAIPPQKSGLGPSENQVAVRKKFRLASRYAKNAMLNPDLLILYTERAAGTGITPYVMAVTDHLKPPVVSEINTDDYAGIPGNKIHVSVDYKVALTEVTVRILDADGVEIEQGVCVVDAQTAYHDYTATVAVADLTGVTVFAKARDYPGHTGQLSVTL